MNNRGNTGKFWSKKYLLNFSCYDSSVSRFFKNYHIGQLALSQIVSMFLKNGQKSKMKREFLKTLTEFNFNKQVKYQKIITDSLNFKIKKKNPLKIVGNFLIKYRIFGRMKSRYIRRRTVSYPAYLTYYNQWRRTIRFLGAFLKKRGIFREKFITEISKLRAKDNSIRRTSILYRSNSLFTALFTKYTSDYGFRKHPQFYMMKTFFSKKYVNPFYEKYKKNSEKSPKFLRRSHPKSRKK